MALGAPRFSKTDVSEADGAPSQNGGETANGLHPDKSFILAARGSEKGQEAEGGGDADGAKGAALTVDVGEERGSLALVGEGGQGAGGAVDGGVADREDGNHDDDVHDRWKAYNSGVFDSDDEGRGGGVRVGLVDEAGVGVGDQKANEREGDDIEQADTPEDLFHGCWEGFSGVGRFGCSKTDEFGSSKGESGSNEDRTKSFEAVIESTGVLPEFPSDIATSASSTNVKDDAKDTGGSDQCVSAS